MMKRLILLLTGWMVALQPAQAAERKFSLFSFEEVRIEGGADVVIVSGKGPVARAEADSRATLDRIAFRKSGKQLVIAVQAKTDNTRQYSAEDPITIYLHTYDVKKISHLGTGTVSLDRLAGRAPEVRVGGFGNLAIASVDSDRLAIAMTGGGMLTIAGEARDSRVQLLGTSTLEASGLTVESLDLVQRGPASSHIMVEREAAITNSGSGVIQIDGRPDCNIRSSGSAQIICDPDS